MAKYLTFDVYGTLLDEAPLYETVAQIGKIIGVNPQTPKQRFMTYQASRDNMHPYLDYTVLLRNNLIHLDYTFNLEHKFEEHFIDVLQAHRELKPFPEVVPTLKELRSRGYQLILMSNSSWDIITANAKALVVPTDIWLAEDVHAYKPDLHFFKAVADHYGFTADNHWHIAEGYPSDIVPVHAMKSPSIWVNRINAKATSVQPTHEVKTLAEALQYLP